MDIGDAWDITELESNVRYWKARCEKAEAAIECGKCVGVDSKLDTEMLDWLERQNSKQRYSGLVIFRLSDSGRGWRLHETLLHGAKATVREAIAEAMQYYKE